MDIAYLCARARALNASDLHLSSGDLPILRVNGGLVRLDECPRIESKDLQSSLSELVERDATNSVGSQAEFDCAVELPEAGRVRLNVYTHGRGIGVALRLIPSDIPSLRDLGLPPWVQTVPQLESGLVLVTGVTGSGKSTTLAAILAEINRANAKHIITIEDPIEFIHTPCRSLISQRQVGQHTGSFASALRSALRQDPDVILIGELRDLETMQLALTAAETGHLVLASLHASGVPRSVDRFIDVFPASQQQQVRSVFAECIRGIISQELVVNDGGRRVALAEIATGTPALRAIIREGKTHQISSIMQISAASGMLART